ncbi:MAG TPA: hypothetical protein VFP64_04300, partial [Pyrinomonadaceae bacterium]|nr:hypothetical protein [Pyrinomonadaceae bacterium]
LTQLSLSLDGDQVIDLQPLKQLKGLTQLRLTLNSSQASDLRVLAPLKELALGLRVTESNLKPLEQLNGLTQLTLYLRLSQVSDLKSVQNLTSLQTLSIYATRTQRMSLRSIPPSLVELRF